MDKVESIRSCSIYPHLNCTSECKERGTCSRHCRLPGYRVCHEYMYVNCMTVERGCQFLFQVVHNNMLPTCMHANII